MGEDEENAKIPPQEGIANGFAYQFEEARKLYLKEFGESCSNELVIFASVTLPHRQITSFMNMELAEKYFTEMMPPFEGKDRAYLQYQRALARAVLKNFEGALSDLNDSTPYLEPTDAALRIARFFVSYKKEEFQNSTTELNQLINLYPSSSLLYLMRSRYGFGTSEERKTDEKMSRKPRTKRPSPAYERFFSMINTLMSKTN